MYRCECMNWARLDLKMGEKNSLHHPNCPKFKDPEGAALILIKAHMRTMETLYRELLEMRNIIEFKRGHKGAKGPKKGPKRPEGSRIEYIK